MPKLDCQFRLFSYYKEAATEQLSRTSRHQHLNISDFGKRINEEKTMVRGSLAKGFVEV